MSVYRKAQESLKKTMESTYSLTAKVVGKRDVETDWGETKQSDKEAISSLKCRISSQSLQADGQTETTNNIDYVLKLFYSPDYDIRQGDKIVIIATDDEACRQWVGKSFEAGTPMPYGSHMELIISGWGYA